MSEYKFFWMGLAKGIHGLGWLVADRWIDKVLEVKRVSERLMAVKVIVGRTVLNLISAYAPQAERHRPEKKNSSPYWGRLCRRQMMVNNC